METLKGYKVTDKNLQCRGFQYEIGKKFTQNGKLILCENGFHFCEIASNCFYYYPFDSNNRVFEIEASGDILKGDDKHCSSEIILIRELSWLEVLTIVNTGKDNSGNWNSGDWNSGNWNSGNRNSGDSNSGYRNSGDRNSGNRNSGNWNSGNRNSGDSNSGYRNDGAFCTDKNPKIRLFDKDCDMTVQEWEQTEVCNLMYRIDPNIWVDSSLMTDKEKEKYPFYKTTGGYLKSISMKEAWKDFWGNLTEEKKSLFTQLPNFDANKFEEITGIKI